MCSRAKGYTVTSAPNGEEALVRIAVQQPDLVLLDIMMPGLSGYDVCRKIRANPATALLPVVLCTSLDPKQERVNGIEAGADDFIPKPINQQELFARVKSLLRIKALQDEVKSQTAQLADWNLKLEERVREQVAQMDRLERLKSFFSPQLAEAIVAGGGDELLKTHRREISVVFIDLRGFTAFTDRAEPEEVMELLHEFHAAMGRIVLEHGGTLERFAGDSVMIFFNDPVPMERPAEAAVRMALAMQQRLPAAGRRMAQARLRAGPGLRHRAGLCHARADRLRRALGLRRHRQRHQPGGAAVRRGRQAARCWSTARSWRASTGCSPPAEIGPLTLKGLTHPVPAFALAPSARLRPHAAWPPALCRCTSRSSRSTISFMK